MNTRAAGMSDNAVMLLGNDAKHRVNGVQQMQVQMPKSRQRKEREEAGEHSSKSCDLWLAGGTSGADPLCYQSQLFNAY